jgi:predicted nucleotidyltransferase
MYQYFNRYRILRVFFDSPGKVFQLRELSRRTKLGLPSVRNHVACLLKDGFVREVQESVYKGFRLADSQKVRSYKRNDLLVRLDDSGLLDLLERRFRPSCIVLFGSAVEGRDDERGDIDLYVQAEGDLPDLDKYEKSLNRNISILLEPDSGKLNKELLNSLANGVTLRGFLKVA